MRSSTKDNYIVVGILAAVMIVAVLVVYRPQGRKLDVLRTSITTLKNVMKSEAQEASGVPMLLREVNKLKSRYRNFHRRLPKSNELAGFLRDISSELADEQDIISESYTTVSPTREELFHKLPIKMRLKGSFLSLASFLDRIANMERLTRVEKLFIKASPDSDDLSVDMQLNIYFTES